MQIAQVGQSLIIACTLYSYRRIWGKCSLDGLHRNGRGMGGAGEYGGRGRGVEMGWGIELQREKGQGKLQ